MRKTKEILEKRLEELEVAEDSFKKKQQIARVKFELGRRRQFFDSGKFIGRTGRLEGLGKTYKKVKKDDNI